MITSVSLVTIVVRDQDEAFAFYTDKLGFKTHTDMRMGPDGPRWLTVIPQSGTGPEITLWDPRAWMGPEAAEGMRQVIGKLPPLGLHTDDCRKTVAELEAKGVTILQQPKDQPYGVEAVFADLYGNSFVLVQPAQQ